MLLLDILLLLELLPHPLQRSDSVAAMTVKLKDALVFIRDIGNLHRGGYVRRRFTLGINDRSARISLVASKTALLYACFKRRRLKSGYFRSAGRLGTSGAEARRSELLLTQDWKACSTLSLKGLLHPREPNFPRVDGAERCSNVGSGEILSICRSYAIGAKEKERRQI